MTRAYNHSITPKPQQKTTDVLLRALVVALITAVGTMVWFSHFNSSFHLDDFPAIVDNSVAHSLSNVPLFFTSPKTYDALPRYNAYRPLLFASFAFDYGFRGADPRPFQFDTFFWFVTQVFLMYFLFRLLAGGSHYAGLFATALYALHPAMADTLDYTLQRGEVLAGVGITAGLLLWIVPRRLPTDLNLTIPVKGVPINWRDLVSPKTARFVTTLYRRILKALLPLYLIPVVFALLANPASAVFPLLLFIYLQLYEPEGWLRRLVRVIPVTVVCAGYWIFQAVFSGQFGKPSRAPIFVWWYTQPWIALRYLVAFFAPVRLDADSELHLIRHFWSPQALAGYAGIAALVWIAIAAERRSEWRAASFGIWWFVITLLPTALIPQQAVEADPRMYLPFAGLALAMTSVAFRVFERLRESRRMGPQVGLAAPILAVALLSAMAWATWERNQVWVSEKSLWADVIDKDPGNGRALMNYGLILISDYDTGRGEGYLARAATLLPRDAPLEVQLAQLAAKKEKATEAEDRFRRAIAFDPGYSPAYSYYSQWLLSRQRNAEALDNALQAARIDPEDLVARRTLMDIYAQRSDWTDLLKIAQEALRLDPNDPDGQRGLRVAQTGVDEIRRSEQAAEIYPTPDNYLRLSGVYFRNARYDDSIAAARSALKLDPDLAEAYFDMANAYHVMGKGDDAIAALREVLRIRPEYQTAKNNLKYELAKKAAEAGR